jgi:hypothetical protein
MSDLMLPTGACWTAESALTMFRVEALEGNDAVFLATHSPIRGFSVDGGSAGDVQDADERALLRAVSDPAHHHAFCVVEGEPGSGKSHLIRWMYVNWPQTGRDIPLLLQRSDGSLEGALAQLREKLPVEFRPLFDGMGTKQKVGEEGRARTFHGNLRQSLRPDHYELPLPDNDWCERWRPGDLLRPDDVEEHWAATRRILRLVSGKEGERNSESARFDVFDVCDLQDIVRRSDIRSAQGQSLYARLVGESTIIEDARAAGRTAEQVVRSAGADVEHHVAFAAALNRRRNDAIQNVIGVTSDSLRKLFREVRTVLRSRSNRLVLLLEDITSWEGLDDSLIDVLTTNSDTRGESEGDQDLCDLVSVIGLTPDYYDVNFRTNYRDRITYLVKLGEGEHGLQDVAMMRDPEDRLRFMARYLAATRAGGDALGQWRKAARHVHDAPPPNPCLDCPLIEGCHSTFGEIDDIGLFPFTRRAVSGFFDALDERDARRTWKTPRGLIQAILRPTLRQPDLIDAGTYPGPNIEVAAFDPATRSAPAMISRLLEVRSDDPLERDRLRRTITFWGAGGDPRTEQDAKGAIAFHGVPKGVFAAFRLPWLGEGDEVLEAAPSSPASLTAEVDEERKPDQGPEVVPPAIMEKDPTNPVVTPRGDPPRVKQDKPENAAPRPRRLRLDPIDVQRFRSEGGKLANPNEWNDALYLIANMIEHRVLGIDGWTWSRLIQPSTLKIEGTATPRKDILILPAEAWLLEGLEAYAASEAESSAAKEVVEYRQSRLARTIRHLKTRLVGYIAGTLGQTAEGPQWLPATAVAQTLLVRAWLRGDADPLAAPADQWAAIFKPAPLADTAPGARTAKWKELLNATMQSNSDMRQMLIESLRLPQGTSKEFGLASGAVAAAFVELCRTMRFRDLPQRVLVQSEARKQIETAAAVVIRSRDLLPSILSDERRLLTERSERLMQMLRGRSIRAHGERIDKAIDDAGAVLSGIASDKVREWKLAYGPLRSSLEGGGASTVQGTIAVFGTAESLEPLDTPQELLAALIKAPAARIADLMTAYSTGESALTKLAEHAEAVVARSGPSAGMESIRDQGNRLIRETRRIRGALEGRS